MDKPKTIKQCGSCEHYYESERKCLTPMPNFDDAIWPWAWRPHLLEVKGTEGKDCPAYKERRYDN